MSESNSIHPDETPDETIEAMLARSTDVAAGSGDQTGSLHIRTSLRAGTGIDWQPMFEASEGAPISG